MRRRFVTDFTRQCLGDGLLGPAAGVIHIGDFVPDGLVAIHTCRAFDDMDVPADEGDSVFVITPATKNLSANKEKWFNIQSLSYWKRKLRMSAK